MPIPAPACSFYLRKLGLTIPVGHPTDSYDPKLRHPLLSQQKKNKVHSTLDQVLALSIVQLCEVLKNLPELK
ncbi:hypothetical protein BGZ96_004489 [Linnemannia gamsii]|uniref:Uncharacterized protein n=1 Tax=Linnemannia gamsii TaxID=64522 RepID=A0ABQ7JI40_9FUNG|nr:hypothetical protein BGZ96_004489 [Linnemannia gamsii]